MTNHSPQGNRNSPENENIPPADRETPLEDIMEGVKEKPTSKPEKSNEKDELRPGQKITDNQWLRRGFIGLVVITLILVGTYFTIGRGGDGPPPKDGDLKITPRRLDPEENGFTYVQEALLSADNLLEKNSSLEKSREGLVDLVQNFLNEKKWDDRSWKEIEKKLKEEKIEEREGVLATVKLLGKAARCKVSQGPIPEKYISESINLQLLHKTGVVELATLSLRAFVAKDFSQAVDRAVDLVRLGQLAVTSRASVFVYIWGVKWQIWGVTLLHKYLPSPEFCRSQIKRLSNYTFLSAGKGEEKLVQGGKEALCIDYQLFSRFIDEFEETGASNDWAIQKVMPIFRLFLVQPNNSKREIGRKTRVLMKMLDQPCTLAMITEKELDRKKEGLLPKVVNPVGQILADLGTIQPKLYKKGAYKTKVLYRALAIRIALWKYKEEKGKWPEKLDQLSPKFIDKIPGDPYHDEAFAYDGAKGELSSHLTKVWTAPEDEGALVFPLERKKQKK